MKCRNISKKTLVLSIIWALSIMAMAYFSGDQFGSEMLFLMVILAYTSVLMSQRGTSKCVRERFNCLRGKQ